MNRAVDTPAAKQARIGRIDNRVNFQRRNVCTDDRNHVLSGYTAAHDFYLTIVRCGLAGLSFVGADFTGASSSPKIRPWPFSFA